MNRIINTELLDKIRKENIDSIMSVAEKELTEIMTGKMYSITGYDIIIVNAGENFLMAKVKGDEKKEGEKNE